jgi:5-methylcytosine-specific restriction endonuclease McrA
MLKRKGGREGWVTEKRRPLTRAQIAELTLRQMGKCAKCGERLDFATKGAVVDEHLHPLADGGTNDTDNRAFYCRGCATPKTAKEARDRGKSKRIAEGRTQHDRRAKAKAEGTHRKMGMRPWPKGRKIQSKPMTQKQDFGP